MPGVGVFELAAIVVMVLLFVVVPVSLILLLVRSIRRESADAEGRDPAMDALRTRFANGQIDQIEFERLRSILQRR